MGTRLLTNRHMLALTASSCHDLFQPWKVVSLGELWLSGKLGGPPYHGFVFVVLVWKDFYWLLKYNTVCVLQQGVLVLSFKYLVSHFLNKSQEQVHPPQSFQWFRDVVSQITSWSHTRHHFQWSNLGESFRSIQFWWRIHAYGIPWQPKTFIFRALKKNHTWA